MKKIIHWLSIFLVYFFSAPIHVYAELDRLALPQGGSVVSGQVDINYAALDRLNVNQSTNQAIVDWQSFNVGRDASVHFNQPTSKASILNNVLSGQSIINGRIYSNGRLFLVNPTGILTGPHSAIKAEGAVLSTLNLSKQNYLNNNLQFNTNANSSLVNQGLIEGQYVALIAPQVNNKGTIITSVATTIAAGDDVLLGISDSNNLTVKVSPSKLQAMAKNEGTIKTQNGIVTIKTDAAQSLVDEVVKLPNARADGLVSENGVIKLVSNSGSIQANKIKIDAGSKGATEISGVLNSNNENGKGGTIEITGKDIDVNSATITANGQTGGGNILIGGDWQGSGDLLQATYLDIDSNSKITANALTSGSGGNIVAWSDIKNSNSLTKVSGTLEAKGIDGNGGQIETSGAVLDINGIKVSTSSVTGSYGNWLVDPTNLTIDASAASTYVTNLASSDVTLTADNTITLSSNLAYTGARNSTLTFNATTTVLNANITSSNGTLSLDFNSVVEIGGANTAITTNGGDVDISGQIKATAASKNLTINAGSGNVTFSSAVTGTSTTTTSAGDSGWYRYQINRYFDDYLDRFNGCKTETCGSVDYTINDGNKGDNYSWRFSGYVQSQGTTSYDFWTNSDDASYVFIGNSGQSLADFITIIQGSNRYGNSVSSYRVVDNRGAHGMRARQGSKTLTQGELYPILVYFGEAWGGDWIDFRFKNTNSNNWRQTHQANTNGNLNFYRGKTTTTTNTLINNLSVTANQFTAGAVKVSGDLTVTNSGNSTISGVISGDTALTKAGSGQLTTSANNTYTGGTTVSAGTLFGGAGSRTNDVFGTGSISVASGATLWVDRSDDGALTNALTLNGGTLYGTNGFGQYWDGNITLGAHSTINAANNFYIDGVISGSSKNLTKTGTGTVILRGTNTYSGTTTVSAGTLNIGGSGSLGSGTYAGNISNSGTFTYASSTAQTLSGVISGSGALTKSGSSTLTLSGTNTYSGDTTISAGAITVSGLLGNGSYAGAIANSGTLTLSSSSAQTLSGVTSGSGGITKSGSGNVTLSGNNTFTGAVTLSSGTLIATANNSLGSSPSITSSSGTNLQISDGVTLPSLAVTGAINLTTDVTTTGAQSYSGATVIGTSSGSATTLTTTNSNITFSDSLKIYQNTTIDSGSGVGDITFSGTVSSHNSASAERNLIVSAGTGNVTFSDSIAAGADYTAGFTQGSFTNESDLDFSGTFLNAINIAGNAVTIGDATFQRGHASYNTSNSNESFQNEISSWSATTWSSTGLTELMRGIRWSGGTGHSPYVQFTNATAGQKYKIQALFKERCCNRYWDIYVDGTKIVDDFKPQLSGGNSGSTGRYLTYQFEASSSNVMFRMSGRTSENGGSRLHGNDVNPILNAISIETLDTRQKINNLIVSGSAINAGQIDVAGDISITNSGTSTISGVVSGTSKLTKAGAGMLSLSGTNTYTGNTTVSAGTLRLSGAGSLGSGTYAGTITNNGIFRSASSTAQILSGVISGTGRVDASGNSGALTLTGTNTYSGGARVASGGILVAGSAGALGSENSVRSTSTSDQFSVSSGVTLSSLRVTGAVRLNSGITTTGAQTYTSDVVVASGTRASPVEFNTTNSNITFGGTLKGEGNSKARSITINAGTGDLEFGDRVGYAFNNENYDANNTADSFYKMTMTANDITIKGDVMTFEEQTYNGNLVVSSTGSNGTTRTLLSIDPKVTINGTVNDSTSSTHTLVAKAVAIRRDGQVAATPEIAFNGKIGTVKALAGYSGVTGYQVVAKNYGVIDDSTSFGTVTGGSQTQVVITQNNNTRSSQSNGRKTEKSANAVSKSAQTTIADAGKNLISTLFGGGPSGGGRTFSKSIEVVMPGDAGFNQPGPETGSGANIDADFSTPGNNQSAPSFEPRGNTSIGGAPAPKSQGGNFNSIDQGTSSPKPRSIRELFRSKDFKNQFSSKQEMRQFKRELRQEFKNNPGSRKSFNKALRDGFDPTDPKSFENATPEQRKAFEEFKEKATPEEQEAFRKFEDSDENPRKLLDKSKDQPDDRGQSKDDNNNSDISEDDEEQKKSGDKSKAN